MAYEGCIWRLHLSSSILSMVSLGLNYSSIDLLKKWRYVFQGILGFASTYFQSQGDCNEKDVKKTVALEWEKIRLRSLWKVQLIYSLLKLLTTYRKREGLGSPQWHFTTYPSVLLTKFFFEKIYFWKKKSNLIFQDFKKNL